MLSGKGGVGKSTVSVALARSFARHGKKVLSFYSIFIQFLFNFYSIFIQFLFTFYLKVGLLDIDLCGPSIPKLVGLEGKSIHQSSQG